MIATSSLSKEYGARVLFENVSLQLNPRPHRTKVDSTHLLGRAGR